LSRRPGAGRFCRRTYSRGLLILAGAFLAGTVALLELGTHWTAHWRPGAVSQSGIFCYRGAVRRLFGEETA
jgi:hypothetical protein